MKTKDIKLGEKTWKIGYNMGVACEFEVESGTDFDFGTTFSSQSNQMTLIWVALKRFNSEFKMTKDEFLDNLSFTDVTEAQKVMAECLVEFYKIPEADAKQDTKEAEDGAKNE